MHILLDVLMLNINHFALETGYNDGSLDAINREDDVIIKGFRLTLTIVIDWIECMKKAVNEGKTDG